MGVGGARGGCNFFLTSHWLRCINSIIHQKTAPPLLDILLGRKDEWMLKERGEAALDYLNFERMLIIISIQINVLSVFAFLVNLLAGERVHYHHPDADIDQEEFSFTPFINQTSMSNLKLDSHWHFYHVIASFLFPYLVLLTAHHFLPTCLTAGGNPPSRFACKRLLQSSSSYPARWWCGG